MPQIVRVSVIHGVTARSEPEVRRLRSDVLKSEHGKGLGKVDPERREAGEALFYGKRERKRACLFGCWEEIRGGKGQCLALGQLDHCWECWVTFAPAK